MSRLKSRCLNPSPSWVHPETTYIFRLCGFDKTKPNFLLTTSHAAARGITPGRGSGGEVARHHRNRGDEAEQHEDQRQPRVIVQNLRALRDAL